MTATVFIRSENEGLKRGCMGLGFEVALQQQPARKRAEAQGEAVERPDAGVNPTPGQSPARTEHRSTRPRQRWGTQGAQRASTHLPMRPLKGKKKGSRVSIPAEAGIRRCVNDPSAGSPTER
jgi:hypothetical protein